MGNIAPTRSDANEYPSTTRPTPPWRTRYPKPLDQNEGKTNARTVSLSVTTTRRPKTVSTTTKTVINTLPPPTSNPEHITRREAPTLEALSDFTIRLDSEFMTNSEPNIATTEPPLDDLRAKFPYPTIFIILVWGLLGVAYMISRWKQRPKQQYVIPRVFVMCSPRTVQFHYELILRVGLPSSDFNPEKHDIDIIVQGLQRNEVVPMTRLNTKTLLDEPLISSLSIIVYRLVEMPQLGTLTLKHSGPFKACVYVYDFTVIDLSTNKEQYYTINQYIGSLNKVYHLDEPSDTINVHYPIDDVPLPQWTLEDVFLILFSVINCLMLSSALMPINCSSPSDVLAIVLATFNGMALVLFLDWFLYYNLRWNQERREFFNQTEVRCFGWENSFRIGVCCVAAVIGILAIYFSFSISDWRDSFVWLLVTTNSSILVIGLWNVGRQVDLGETLVAFGLRFRGVETVPVGTRYSEASSTIQTKSGSASDEDAVGSNISSSHAGRAVRSIGPRSSVKSFGFDPVLAQANRRLLSRINSSVCESGTGATPNTQLSPHSLHPAHRLGHSKGMATESQASLSGLAVPAQPLPSAKIISADKSTSGKRGTTAPQTLSTSGANSAKRESSGGKDNAISKEHSGGKENSKGKDHLKSQKASASKK